MQCRMSLLVRFPREARVREKERNIVQCHCKALCFLLIGLEVCVVVEPCG